MTVKLCAFDIETTGNVPEFKCGAIFSDRMSAVYWDSSEMIDEMRRHARQRYTFVAHNAEYDTAVLLWGTGEDVSITYTNNLFSTARWRYGNGNSGATIWDNMRLCAGLSLAELGEAIGLPKYATPHKLINPMDWRRDWVCDSHHRPGCIDCYVLRDAEIVWCYCNSLREWLTSYGLSLYNSLPRTAIDLWRMFDHGSQQMARSPEIRALGRQGYHSGRNEVFIYGHTGRVYTGDFRSHYGAILRDVALPDMSQLRLIRRPSHTRLPDSGDGIVTATVDIDNQHIPPLPVTFYERSYYPVGTVHGTWPISELRYAVGHGVTIRSIDLLAHSERSLYPFANTAGMLLELRESLRLKKDARELVAKFILNTIPGRLAVREQTERLVYRKWRAGIDGKELKGYELESAGRSLFLARRHILTKPSTTSNILWASIITARGRIKLHRKLLENGQANIYCDTDSVHSLGPLVCEDGMPGLFRDTGVYDRGVYLGSKLYSLERDDGEKDARAKGIPRKYAVQFIGEQRVAYQTTLGVVDGILRGVGPCVWVDVDRVARFAPGTRTIVEPDVLSGKAQRSATTPVVFSMSGDSLTTMETRSMINP